MKKLFVACVALVIALVVVGIAVVQNNDSGMTDEEMMEIYIDEIYGDQFHGKLTVFENPIHEDVIYFTLYREGEETPFMYTGIDRSWYEDYH